MAASSGESDPAPDQRMAVSYGTGPKLTLRLQKELASLHPSNTTAIPKLTLARAAANVATRCTAPQR